ncbi:hypothetical protein EK21DRAFT_80779, partial [Setomelanomma holmii]
STGLNETVFRCTAIGLLVVTTIVVLVRAVLRIDKRWLQWDELWLAVGYVLFLIVTGTYINKTKQLFQLLAVGRGQAQPYEGLAHDWLAVQTMYFFTCLGLWLTLWSIKFSLLAFYKRIMIDVPVYITLWRIVLGYCVFTLVLTIILLLTACPTPAGWFKTDGCNAAENVRRSLTSFWGGFASQITDSLQVMLLPIDLIRRLQMPLNRKIQIGSLFALGALVIVASVIRAVQVGSTPPKYQQPSLHWLAFWSIVESAVAIMVGYRPGLYRKARFQCTSAWPNRNGNRELGDKLKGTDTISCTNGIDDVNRDGVGNRGQISSLSR